VVLELPYRPSSGWNPRLSHKFVHKEKIHYTPHIIPQTRHNISTEKLNEKDQFKCNKAVDEID
jgi:hypothetical protein